MDKINKILGGSLTESTALPGWTSLNRGTAFERNVTIEKATALIKELNLRQDSEKQWSNANKTLAIVNYSGTDGQSPYRIKCFGSATMKQADAILSRMENMQISVPDKVDETFVAEWQKFGLTTVLPLENEKVAARLANDMMLVHARTIKGSGAIEYSTGVAMADKWHYADYLTITTSPAKSIASIGSATSDKDIATIKKFVKKLLDRYNAEIPNIKFSPEFVESATERSTTAPSRLDRTLKVNVAEALSYNAFIKKAKQSGWKDRGEYLATEIVDVQAARLSKTFRELLVHPTANSTKTVFEAKAAAMTPDEIQYLEQKHVAWTIAPMSATRVVSEEAAMEVKKTIQAESGGPQSKLVQVRDDYSAEYGGMVWIVTLFYATVQDKHKFGKLMGDVEAIAASKAPKIKQSSTTFENKNYN